jgi:hypothetical protein
MKPWIGAGFGLLIVYLFGALIAWDWNPGDWHLLWRLWCAAWGIIWASSGAIICGDS